MHIRRIDYAGAHFEAFSASRQQMLMQLNGWLGNAPGPEAAAEVVATLSAILQLAALSGHTVAREGQ